MHHGEFLSLSCLVGVLCAFCICVGISFSNLGNFSFCFFYNPGTLHCLFHCPGMLLLLLLSIFLLVFPILLLLPYPSSYFPTSHQAVLLWSEIRAYSLSFLWFSYIIPLFYPRIMMFCLLRDLFYC